MTLNTLDPQAFAGADRKTWLAVVGKALKGADFERTLVSATDDGIAVQPLYARQADAVPLGRRQPLLPWTIAQRMDDPSPDRALTQLADDLASGATGINIVRRDSACAFGLGLVDSEDKSVFLGRLATVIDGRPVALRLEAGDPSAAMADGLVQVLGAQPAQTVHCGLDPFTAAAFGGTAADTADLAAGFRRLLASRHAGTILNADGRIIHNAGGTEAEELAVMAAAVVAYLRLLGADGIPPETVLGAVSLCLCADQNQFVSIAKARAARLLFARIAEACGVHPPPRPHLFMETSYRMLAYRDPETNILRNSIAVFAAGIGGADEISVLPHTLTHGIPDGLARRLARNTQRVLMAESHLDHVADPAAGAGGIEALTEALAARAWAVFGEIEADGGLAAAIDTGRLAAMVAQSREKRPTGRIVGTSLYVADVERPVAVLGAFDRPDRHGLRPVRRDEEMG